jgi:ribosome-associated protein
VASYCDGFLLCNGTNRRHVRAIAEGILDDMRAAGHKPIGVEGLDASRWVLLDFGDVLVHVFDEPMRGFYDLDGLWADARRLQVDPTPLPAAGGVSQTGT